MYPSSTIEKATLTAMSANYTVTATFEPNVFEVREGNGAVRVVKVDFQSQSCSCSSRSGQACDQYIRSGTCRHVGSVLKVIAHSVGLPVMPVPAPVKPLPQPSRVGRAPQWYGVGRYSRGF